jgi:hypothetical protein
MTEPLSEREAGLLAEIDELRVMFDSVQAILELAQEGREEQERLAEIRGAAWACDWYWSQGLRHHGANPAQICHEARQKPGE